MSNSLLKNRNYAFDVLKIVGIIFIVLHHSHLISSLKNGYMFVEMFFIISGFFLYKTCLEKDTTVLEFIKSRLKKLYLPYILAWFSLVLVFLIVKGNVNYAKWYSPILEVLMLQNLGLPGSGGINTPCWYLSVLFYGSILFFILFKYFNKKIVNILLLIISTTFYGYVLLTGANLERWDFIVIPFYFPFVRGISALTLGGLIYQISSNVNKKYKLNIVIFTVLIFIFSSMFINYNLDILLLLLFFVLVLVISLSNDNLLEGIGKTDLVKRICSIEYYMYLNHILIIYIVLFISKNINIPNIISIVLLFFTLIVFSIIMKYVVNLISRVFNKLN